MSGKYWNNTPPSTSNRIYTQDGLPVLGNMILPSDENVEKILKPFNWVKDRVSQSMEDWMLSPFPKIIDFDPEWTKRIKDYLIDFDSSKVDTELYPDFLEKMKIISDFLQDGCWDMFISCTKEYSLNVNLIKKWVIHNQHNLSLDSDELELILLGENDPFNEMS